MLHPRCVSPSTWTRCCNCRTTGDPSLWQLHLERPTASAALSAVARPMGLELLRNRAPLRAPPTCQLHLRSTNASAGMTTAPSPDRRFPSGRPRTERGLQDRLTRSHLLQPQTPRSWQKEITNTALAPDRYGSPQAHAMGCCGQRAMLRGRTMTPQHARAQAAPPRTTVNYRQTTQPEHNGASRWALVRSPRYKPRR